MNFPFQFDFKNPDYIRVFDERIERLKWLREDPERVSTIKAFYRDDPAQFITDWGCTVDPRNVERGLPAVIPFILFPRQVEWVHWFMDCWKGQRPGVVPKSREMGLSWLTVGVACTLCLFHEGLTIGYGSRKEEYVDKTGDPKSLFYKARKFVASLPLEFRGDWNEKKNSSHMLLRFPQTQSVLSGEAGDGFGRGGRYSVYFTDEAAHVPRPHLVEASLSQATNCRIDISTPRGMNNPFFHKVNDKKIDSFFFHWRDDPRKDDAWYKKQCDEINDPVIIAQEIDLCFNASVEGVVIPNAWVQAAIDAHITLGIQPSGMRRAGLDVADEGRDMNALGMRYGFLIEQVVGWSGKDSDIYRTVEKALNLCDVHGYSTLYYDADGLGAGVRGDAKVINEKRKKKIDIHPFRGSAAVVDPEREMISGRENKDFFANYKAQAWWALRKRFQMTYRAVVEKLDYDPDEIISISSAFVEYRRLVTELSQATFQTNNAGKIVIDKTPEGAKSPNHADAVVICFAPMTKPVRGFFSETTVT